MVSAALRKMDSCFGKRRRVKGLQLCQAALDQGIACLPPRLASRRNLPLNGVFKGGIRGAKIAARRSGIRIKAHRRVAIAGDPLVKLRLGGGALGKPWKGEQ